MGQPTILFGRNVGPDLPMPTAGEDMAPVAAGSLR